MNLYKSPFTATKHPLLNPLWAINGHGLLILTVFTALLLLNYFTFAHWMLNVEILLLQDLNGLKEDDFPKGILGFKLALLDFCIVLSLTRLNTGFLAQLLLTLISMHWSEMTWAAWFHEKERSECLGTHQRSLQIYWDQGEHFIRLVWWGSIGLI